MKMSPAYQKVFNALDAAQQFPRIPECVIIVVNTFFNVTNVSNFFIYIRIQITFLSMTLKQVERYITMKKIRSYVILAVSANMQSSNIAFMVGQHVPLIQLNQTMIALKLFTL